jgi:hypothetical protein
MQLDSARYEELTHQQIDLAERTLTHQPEKSKVHAALANAYAGLAQAAALKEMRSG